MTEIFDNLRSPDDKLVNDMDRIIHKAERMYTQAEVNAAVATAISDALRAAADIAKWAYTSSSEMEILALIPASIRHAAELRELEIRQKEAEYWNKAILDLDHYAPPLECQTRLAILTDAVEALRREKGE